MAKQIKYLQELLSGDIRALSKSISLVENSADGSEELLDGIYCHTGKAHRIGITGPPGAGKSTLVQGLAKQFRSKNKSVGILAVDPTSPFTGGALLGDRVRMNEIVLDDQVFIRSMASRGSLGGLARCINEAADLLDAYGKQVILIETVGVGQSELDIVQSADTVLVVLVPESGDAIQAMKAGLMEIADIFVVNKADREGADRAVLEIETILQLKSFVKWQPPVLRTVASSSEGIEDIMVMLAKHQTFLKSDSLWQQKRKNRAISKVHELVRRRLETSFWNESTTSTLNAALNREEPLSGSPYRLAKELLDSFSQQECSHGRKESTKG